jgi:hypothetical protein
MIVFFVCFLILSIIFLLGLAGSIWARCLVQFVVSSSLSDLLNLILSIPHPLFDAIQILGLFNFVLYLTLGKPVYAV